MTCLRDIAPRFFFTVSPVSGQQGGPAARPPRAVPLPPAVPAAGLHFLSMRIRMEHSVINRHWRPSSTGAPSGREQARRRGVNELVELIGLPATLELIRAKGGTALRIPLGVTLRGQELRENLVQIVGREQATRLIGRYGGTTLYIPSCRQAFVDTRDEKINKERDELARKGLTERALVSVLALRHGLSDRQIWRILKKSGPVSADMAACAAARRRPPSSTGC